MQASATERRLAAILAADVVGYSRLMERDEVGTLARLRAHRQAFLEPLVAAHQGRVVKLMGDGALVEFPSAVEAVACAVALQAGIAERERDVPEQDKIRFRLGINVGDIILEDGDIYGDGVNIAARLQTLAEPGGICLSRNTYEEVRNKLALAFAPMGEQKVKNISAPVGVWRVRPEGAVGWPAHTASRAPNRWVVWAAAVLLVLGLASAGAWYGLRSPVAGTEPGERQTADASTTALPAEPTLIVLPFANMSGDLELDYFSDGLTEDLTTQLARNPELRVAARNTAFAYKGKAVDVRSIARDLGVRYALEGSVRRGGDKVRITAQLIDATTGNHVWAERYDGEGSDIFALQDAVTQKVMSALGGFHGQIREADYRRVWSKPKASLEEYDYFLRIHDLIVSDDPEKLDQARQVALEGLQRFPDSGLMRIKLGWTYMQRFDRGQSADPDRDLAEAYRLGKEGMQRPDLPALAQWHGHWLMALANLYTERDHAAALAEREATLAAAPTDQSTRADLARVLVFAGMPDAAIASLNEVIAEKPRSVGWMFSELGRAYCSKGQYEEGIAFLRKVSQPAAIDYQFLAACYGLAGRMPEARSAAARLMELSPSLDLDALRRSNPYKDQGFLGRYLAALHAAGVPDRPS
ncbi:adenylate/guanylate cyclase domain-containing protein [Benzoatithermus flavus]|uniref:Adenylate/guanylate cyclase domain-containing protein n=1 Tax=Benzoatithermus flavus TaxID=3108223 RepID=A0ABU8XLD1_9PROT